MFTHTKMTIIQLPYNIWIHPSKTWLLVLFMNLKF